MVVKILAKNKPGKDEKCDVVTLKKEYIEAH